MVEAKACHGTYELGYGAVVNYTSFIRDPIVAEAIFEQLLAETEWEQRSVIIFGRARPQPRLVAYYATDIERGSYTYSGACSGCPNEHGLGFFKSLPTGLNLPRG